jgi:hypothetical protein
VKTKAGTGVMWPLAKECWEPPEAGNDHEGASPRGLQEKWPF